MKKPLDHEKVKEQLEVLLGAVEWAKSRAQHSDLSGDGIPRGDLLRLRVRLEAAVQRLIPRGSAYADAAEELKGEWDGDVVLGLASILQVWRSDVEAGYLDTLEDLVRADLFDDFLEMSDELLEKGYKDAAAVIAGSVLERHLRAMASSEGIALEGDNGKPKRAETINSDLVKAGRYEKLTQKVLTVLLDLRNKAAHGEYEKYGREQVKAMVRDIRSFMERHPV